MSSSIFFRFKSQKEPLQITFDGTSLSVFEVKREIIALSKLGDGTDFDLDIYSSDGKEIYDDDTTQIPRSTTVVARRHPSRPGAGRAARYVTGKMPVNAKNSHRIEASATSVVAGNQAPTMHGTISGGKDMTEEEKLKALLSANDQSWKADQASMSHKPVVRSTYNKSAAVPDKPLPPGYICYRCGEPGHWIQACPTNNDPNFDNRKKIKRTTGIPRSFLKAVEKPADGDEATNIDPSNLPKGVMYTASGEMVTFEPDNATWEKIQEKTTAAAEKAKEAASDEQEIRDRGLECSLHNGIFVEPVKTPCCGVTYCNNCIESALLDNDLKCPNCETQPVLLDKLEPDEEMVAKMKAYEEEKKAEKEKKAKDTVDSPSAASPRPTDEKEASEAGEGQVNGEEVAVSTPNAKKRQAEDELENDRRPSNPATEANRTDSKQDTSTPQPPIAPAADIAEFQKQMQAMSASMQNGGMPAMMNPMGMPAMPGFNSAMMGMPGMNMNMPMNIPMGMMNPMMGMPGMGMGMNMPNFHQMNGMGGNMNGWNGGQMGGNWQGGGWGGNGIGMGMQQGNGAGAGGNDGAYMRQPVNPNRHRGRYNRPRSADYRQV